MESGLFRSYSCSIRSFWPGVIRPDFRGHRVSRFGPTGTGLFGPVSKVGHFGMIKGISHFGLIYLFQEKQLKY